MKIDIDFKAVASQMEDIAVLLDLLSLAQDLVLQKKQVQVKVFHKMIVDFYSVSAFSKDHYEFFAGLKNPKLLNFVSEANSLVESFYKNCRKIDNQEEFFKVYGKSVPTGMLACVSAICSGAVDEGEKYIDYFFTFFLKHSESFNECEGETFMASLDMAGRSDLVDNLQNAISAGKNKSMAN